MEILAGVIISFAMSVLKWMTKKLGLAMTRLIITISLFVVVFTITYLKETGRLPMEFFMQMYQILAISIANYEIIIKRFLRPIFEDMGLLKTK